MKTARPLFAAFAAATLSIALAVPGRGAEPSGGTEAQPAEVKASAPEAAKPSEQADSGKTDGKAEGSPAPASPTAPVVIVNGTAITQADYDRVLDAYMRNFQMMSGNLQGQVSEPNEAMKQEVIDQLVSRELLYQESLKYPDADQKKKVEEQLKGIQQRFPTPEAYQEALKAQGFSEKELEGLIDKQVSVRHYVEAQIAPKASVPDEEVRKFYDENKEKFASPEQVRASHILIRCEPDAKPEDKEKAKAKAEEVRKRAAGGEEFAALATENSEDPGSKDSGGDLGFFTKDRMVEPFADAAFGLKVGEVSGVVETQFGYHVIKCTDRKEAGTVGFEEVKDNISAYLKGRALDEAVQAKVQELKRDAKVELVAPHP